jgi:hypothetical protein
LFDQLLEILLHRHHRHHDGCKLDREACAKVAADKAEAFGSEMAQQRNGARNKSRAPFPPKDIRSDQVGPDANP